MLMTSDDVEKPNMFLSHAPKYAWHDFTRAAYLCMALCFALTAHPAWSDESVHSDPQYIYQEHLFTGGKTVRVGVAQNPPIGIHGKGKPPQGFAVDIIRDVAKTERWNLSFVEKPWPQLLKQLDAGRIDLLGGIAHTPARAKKYDFSSQASANNWAVVYRDKKTVLNSIADLNGKRIALIPGNVHTVALENLAASFGFRYIQVPVKYYAQALESVDAGQADVGIVARTFHIHNAEKYKALPTDIRFNPIELRFAAPKGTGSEILAAIDRHLSIQKNDPTSHYSLLLAHWFTGPVKEVFPLWAYWTVGVIAIFAFALWLGVVWLRREVNARTKEVRESEKKFKVLTEASPVGVFYTDPNGNCLFTNQKWCTIAGMSQNQALGQGWANGLHPDDKELVFTEWSAATENNRPFKAEYRFRTTDGKSTWVVGQALAQFNDTNEIVGFVGTLTDITERKRAEEHINQLAHHDALTGLLNRYSFEERLEQALRTARRTQQHLAVLFIDLDHFKNINDTIGHHAGDAVLIEVARRLRAISRESDIVARLGGDEFVVILNGLKKDTDATPVAEKIMRTLSEPYQPGKEDVHSTTSIGISVFPMDGDNAEVLMQQADTAMYHVKAQGRNGCQFFTPEMNAEVQARVTLEKDLRTALEDEQFELYYQPKINASNMLISGVEALIRWHHPDRGLVPPDEFITFAEETGLIIPIGEWVIQEACRQQVEWREQGLKVSIAVNLSVNQLYSPRLITQFKEAFQRYEISSGDIEAEITETTAMHNPDEAIVNLTALGNIGVDIAIDDFGTGYSSLSHLKRLPIQFLKLDRSFVRDITTDENDAAISAATVALAHQLGLKVIAEGVETEAQQVFLSEIKCDHLQGYLFSKPLPKEEAAAFLRSRET